jgi:hypothetical protein
MVGGSAPWSRITSPGKSGKSGNIENSGNCEVSGI